ncbi:MAG TPA: formyltransferase family protein [Planctomycetaceae bacterium]|nr:formyltransferase family protein [Planctomycetaceae bacterium]
MTETPAGPNLPRVLLLTSPGLFGGEIVNGLAETNGIELAGVGLTGRLYKNKGPLKTLLTFRKRTGWAYTRTNLLTSTIAAARMRLTGKPKGLREIKERTRVLQDINAPESLKWMTGLQPDFIASFFFNQWIGAGVREIPARDCVNLHPSLLPQLRGPDPVFRTLEQNLASSGFTIHRVADEFDAGTVLHQQAFDVPQDVSWVGLYRYCARNGSRLLGDWLAGRVECRTVSSSAEAGEYQTFPTPEEVARFLKAGHRLGSVGEVHRSVSELS